MKDKIQQVLSNNLPKGVFTKVWEQKALFSDSMVIYFMLYTSENTINRVDWQFPDAISFRLYLEDMELAPQCIGGCGGQVLYRNIDPSNHKEQYLAMQGVKVPFRKPQANEVAILKAVKKLCHSYIETLQSFKDMGLLRYTDYSSYTFLN